MHSSCDAEFVPRIKTLWLHVDMIEKIHEDSILFFLVFVLTSMLFRKEVESAANLLQCQGHLRKRGQKMVCSEYPVAVCISASVKFEPLRFFHMKPFVVFEGHPKPDNCLTESISTPFECEHLGFGWCTIGFHRASGKKCLPGLESPSWVSIGGFINRYDRSISRINFDWNNDGFG